MFKQSVSVFFPCYNDERTIGELVRIVDALLKKRNAPYEIIVVNDGSTDNSATVLRNVKKEVPRLRMITHQRNQGYGAALRDGFRAAKFDLVFYTDGDGQYDIRELELLFPLMTPDIDVVNGIKMERNDPWIRIAAGKGYNFFVRNLFGIKIFDIDCDFRLIRRKVLENITLTSRSGAICVELIKKLQDQGARFREVTVHHYDRKHGRSQFFKPARIVYTMVELAKFWIDRYISKGLFVLSVMRPHHG